MTEFLVFVLVISGLLTGIIGAAVIAAVITGAIWHYFPNCWYIRWIKAEVIQEEELTFKGEQQDWIAKRMSK